MEEIGLKQIDYERECHDLRIRLENALAELEKYKKALLNVCLNIKGE